MKDTEWKRVADFLCWFVRLLAFTLADYAAEAESRRQGSLGARLVLEEEKKLADELQSQFDSYLGVYVDFQLLAGQIEGTLPVFGGIRLVAVRKETARQDRDEAQDKLVPVTRSTPDEKPEETRGEQEKKFRNPIEIALTPDAEDPGKGLRLQLINSTSDPIEHVGAELLKLSWWSRENKRFETDSQPTEAYVCGDATIDPETLVPPEDQTGYRFLEAAPGQFRVHSHRSPSPEVTRKIPGTWRAIIKLKRDGKEMYPLQECFSWMPDRVPMLQPEACPSPFD